METAANHLLIHTAFDALAWLAAAATLVMLRRTWFADNPVGQDLRFGYLAAVLFGAGIGAWAFGTLNGWVSGHPGLARSVEGALAGAILSIELYKRLNGITVRTGAVYVLPLTLGIGGNIAPQLRKLSTDNSKTRNASRFAIMLGVDIPIFVLK